MLLTIMFLGGCKSSQKNKLDSETPDDNVLTNNIQDDEQDTNLRETILYYQNDDGYLVPVMRKIPWEEGIAKAALSYMMDTKEQQKDLMAMGLKALMPGNTEINGLSIKDGLAKIDFKNDTVQFENPVSESNMVQGIVLTLCEFPAIDKVQFMFDGKIKQSMKNGTDVSKPLAPQDINLEMGQNIKNGEGKLTVFFHSTSDTQYDYLVPVTRIISASELALDTAIGELLKGPKSSNVLKMDIPQGTKLLDTKIENGTAYINFNKEFSALGNEPRSEAIVMKSIAMTAKQFSGVDYVKIMVDGKEYEGVEQLNLPTFANEY